MSINSTRNKNLNLTSTNIANRLLLAKCCYADYAIDFLQKKNIGDNEQASCYLNKMKQLYYSMKSLCQYTPASECAPSLTIAISPTFLSGTVIYYVDDVQISSEFTVSAVSIAEFVVTTANAINTYQEDYTASFTSTTSILTSNTSGTSDNGLVVTGTLNGVSYTLGTLSGGIDQWCLDDTKAQNILDNIDQLCGCPCDECDDLLGDTIPKYIN